MSRAAIHVALLRAINLGAHKRVAMTDLRRLLTQLGFSDAESLLQSGNLVFRSPRRNGAQLERLLESETEKRLGLRTDYFVRTAEEWRAVVAGNPLPDEAERDPAHLLVVFLKDAPAAGGVAALRAAIKGRESVIAVGRQAFVAYPDGVGRSALTLALIERKLGTRGTGRNWNTVVKLAALAGA